MPIEVIYPRKSNESAKDYSYKNLLFNIATLILTPGASIEEVVIANKLDVSRTPVREAILRLNKEYFINILPQKSTTVSHIDTDFIEQGMFAFKAIEKAIIEGHCLALDQNFISQVKEIVVKLEQSIESKDNLTFFELNYHFHRLLFNVCKKDKVFTTLEFFYFHLLRESMVEPSLLPLSSLVDDIKRFIEAVEKKEKKDAIMYHAFYIEHLSSDHETLKTAYPSYFLHL
ncbi:MAG: GntR family transcriptional regulator [Spirochaetia bacterium]|nr:GntR family transcriptional regulator [Spirochaetia bacterium]